MIDVLQEYVWVAYHKVNMEYWNRVIKEETEKLQPEYNYQIFPQKNTYSAFYILHTCIPVWIILSVSMPQCIIPQFQIQNIIHFLTGIFNETIS